LKEPLPHFADADAVTPGVSTVMFFLHFADVEGPRGSAGDSLSVRPFTSPCDSSSDFKLPRGKETRELSTKVGATIRQVHIDKSHLSNAIPTLSHGKDELLPMKGLIFQTLFLPKREMCSSIKKLLLALLSVSPH
jgi:hypothetical protein